MKLSELFNKENLNEMGIFGKKVKIKANATGSAKDHAGKVGKVINISPDRDRYYLEFDGDTVWISAKNIEGVKLKD